MIARYGAGARAICAIVYHGASRRNAHFVEIIFILKHRLGILCVLHLVCYYGNSSFCLKQQCSLGFTFLFYLKSRLLFIFVSCKLLPIIYVVVCVNGAHVVMLCYVL